MDTSVPVTVEAPRSASAGLSDNNSQHRRRATWQRPPTWLWHALRHSWTVWERYGNMVSSTVFFVLRELQETAPPRDGDIGLMLAFGAGVSCEMVLLRGVR